MKDRKRRPPETGTPVMVRLQPDLLDWLDAERARLDPAPSRPEMIRVCLEERRGRAVESGAE